MSWWGAVVLGALDASLIYFFPFGIDTLVIYLAARERGLFWLYPLLATAGSLAGGAVTFRVGRRMGQAGLGRLLPQRRLERIQQRVRKGGAFAMIVPALLPPPFPLTPFILACGALDVSQWRFLVTFGAGRLVRFGVASVLAARYGSGILGVLESDTFRAVIIGFIALAIVGTVASAIVLWRNTHDGRSGSK